MKLLFILLCVCFFMPRVNAQAKLFANFPKNKKEEKKIIETYLKYHETFRSMVCNPSIEKEFNLLNKNYKEFGKFIPITLDDKIDTVTIKNHIGLFDEKEKWISWNIERLQKNFDRSKLIFLVNELKNQREELIHLKHKYFIQLSVEERRRIEAESSLSKAKFIKDFNTLIEQTPFLLSFKFPVDHLELRKSYDHFKEIKTKEARLKSNSIFFNRRILQDGMYDEDFVKNDSVLRSAIDSFSLSLLYHSRSHFFTEIERFDSLYVLNAIEKFLEIDAEKLISRFISWRERNRQLREFYKSILDNKILRDGEFSTVQKLLEDKAKATFALKDFVLKKEAESFKYWSNQDELFQALYVFESILYSEVGTLDGRNAEERNEIARVVLNRYYTDKYNFIDSSDSLYSYLVNTVGNHLEIKDKKIVSHKWLNVLFKEAEFSFTLFFISGNLHVYCPDMSRTGRFLRKENVKIALETLKKGLRSYEGLRYYSRYSMQGRIEMDSVWEDYLPIPERPGKKSPKSQALIKKFKNGQYRFLYDFIDSKNNQFFVVEIDERPYVVSAENPKDVFNYRNIHMFKFFGPKSSQKK